MPNRKTHTKVGAISGATYAFYKAKDQELLHIALETLGGALAGYVGGRIPDIIDPATSPRHRSIGHGILPNGILASLYMNQIDGWQQSLRHQAKQFCEQRKSTDSVVGKAGFRLLELLCYLSAGALAGLFAGHISHLLLDLSTPAKLPLLA